MAGPRFLRSKVAARILTLFFVGAIVPVVFLQILSFGAVSDLLEEQSEDRLAQLADATVQLILERLASSSTWVESVGAFALSAAEGGETPQGVPSIEQLAPALEAVAVVSQGRVREIAGSVGSLPELASGELERIRAGDMVLKQRSAPESTSPLLYLATRPSALEDVVWARLAPDSIWTHAMVLGAGRRVDDLCILDAARRPMACRRGPTSALAASLADMELEGVQGRLSFRTQEGVQLAAWRRVYLRAAYGAPDWLVVVSEAESSVHAPVANFAYNLPLALAVGVGLVLLLANVLVRRTMEPLQKLTEGTRRIARHELEARVEVDGDDEFGELAASFNDMAGRLSIQFAQIESARAIDRAVIEDNNSTRAIAALLEGIERLMPDADGAVLLVEDSAMETIGLYRRDGNGAIGRTALSSSDLARTDALAADGLEVAVDMEALPEPFREPPVRDSRGPRRLIPMRVQGSRIGYTALGADERSEVDLERTRQLIDQAAIALNENRLRRDLVELSGEALRALANAIDAKSQWTTGHSERVTDLAWAIGRRMGLGVLELETLHRGGLVHDIGKIGVSNKILDWSGKLDEAQRRAIEAHTVIGARILEPVRVFRPLLPIVLHHHERWDGNGYPHGLAGEDIPLLARVLAVADVFDAMASPRPYRGPLPTSVVMEHIRTESGRAFEPDIVDAFEAVIASGWVHRVPNEGAPSG